MWIKLEGLCLILLLQLVAAAKSPNRVAGEAAEESLSDESAALAVDGESRAGGIFQGLMNLWSKPHHAKQVSGTGKPKKMQPTQKAETQVFDHLKSSTLAPAQSAPSQQAKIPPTATTGLSAASRLTTVTPTAGGPIQYTREQLESALDSAGVKCGTVPLFERAIRKSINESLTEEEREAQGGGGDFRIINGIDSTPGEWPWVVRITECPPSTECFTCTGTLLNNRWVISAGHCGFNRSAVTNFKATLGLYDMVSPDKSAFETTFDRIIVHPDYHELNNDLALFRLAAPISFSEFVQPACLVRATRNVLQYTFAKRCYAVGYGLTAGMVAAVKLQKLRIKPRPPRECNSDTLGSVQLRRNTVCIGVPDGQTGATCKGDSGGPDLCYDAKLNRWELFGTVSYGPADCDRDTGEKWLTVSVDLSNYRSWILSTVLANS